MASIRVQKVQEEIKRTVGSILTTDIKDTKLGFMTVSRVKCSADLRYAKIYISIYEDNDKAKAAKMELLQKRKGLIRGFLGSYVRFRHVPEIEFFLDDSLDYAEKIDKLIDEVHQEENNRDTDENIERE
jgi:ribosome-binding factor A